MNLYQQISSNKRKTWVLMLGFIIFITVVAYIIGEFWLGETTIVIPFIFISLVINLFAYYLSDKTALALAGAHEVGIEEERQYFQLVHNLTIATGMPMPSLHVIESEALNAFATGRDPDHAAIAVTRGLLNSLDKRELEGVLAHELSHIKNFDTRLMTMVVVLVGMVALLTDFAWRASLFGGRKREDRGNGVMMIVGLVLIILAPIIANIIKLAVSRQREYLADASAAYITRYPQGLIDALTKIAFDPHKLETAKTATAHMFIYNPLKDGSQKLAGLFSTHPPVEERIARLKEM